MTLIIIIGKNTLSKHTSILYLISMWNPVGSEICFIRARRFYIKRQNSLITQDTKKFEYVKVNEKSNKAIYEVVFIIF